MIEHRGVREVDELVRRSLPKFAEECLAQPDRLVVAIESEGMAILLPYMSPADFARVIPDTVLDSVDPDTIRGREVLVVDASVFEGGKMWSVANRLKGEFGAKEVVTAGFVVCEECTPNKMPQRKQLLLSSSRYSWAKWSLSSQQLDQLVTLDGDHPSYVFRIKQGKPCQLIEAIRRFGTCYGIGGEDNHRVRRFTVDGVGINTPVCWLPASVWLESIVKVRLFVEDIQDADSPRFSVLPLVYPSVPVTSVCTRELCIAYDADIALCQGAGKARDEDQDSKRCFRCLALYASLLLLLEFLERLMVELPKGFAFELEVDEPTTTRAFSLYDLEQGDVIRQAVQNRIANALTARPKNGQMELPFQKFNFGEDRTDELVYWHTRQNAIETEYHSPEFEVVLEIAKWWLNEVKFKIHDRDERDGYGLPFGELCRRLQGRVSPLAISRSFDQLLDQGILRPRISKFARRDNGSQAGQAFWVRGYRPGGEFVGRRLDALAMAAERVSESA